MVSFNRKLIGKKYLYPPELRKKYTARLSYNI